MLSDDDKSNSENVYQSASADPSIIPDKKESPSYGLNSTPKISLSNENEGQEINLPTTKESISHETQDQERNLSTIEKSISNGSQGEERKLSEPKIPLSTESQGQEKNLTTPQIAISAVVIPADPEQKLTSKDDSVKDKENSFNEPSLEKRPGPSPSSENFNDLDELEIDIIERSQSDNPPPPPLSKHSPSSFTDIQLSKKDSHCDELPIFGSEDINFHSEDTIDVSAELVLMQKKFTYNDSRDGKITRTKTLEDADDSISIYDPHKEKTKRHLLIAEIREIFNYQTKLKMFNDFLSEKIRHFFVKKDQASGLSEEDHEKQKYSYEHYNKLLRHVLRPLFKSNVIESKHFKDYESGTQFLKIQNQMKKVEQEYKDFCKYRLEKVGHDISVRSQTLKMLEEEGKAESRLKQLRTNCFLIQISISREKERGEKFLNLSCGLRVVDFECMKMTLHTCQSSLESIMQDIKTYKKKVSNLVSLLSHFKEKLHDNRSFVAQKRHQLNEIDIDLEIMRTSLHKLKTDKANESKIMTHLKQGAGLLEFPLLISHSEDLEERNLEIENKLMKMKKEQKRLSKNTAQYKLAINYFNKKFNNDDLSQFKMKFKRKLHSTEESRIPAVRDKTGSSFCETNK